MYSQLLVRLNDLTRHHLDACQIYSDYVQSYFPHHQAKFFEELPFLPVRAFKGRELRSVPEEQVYRRMYSSGTGALGKSLIALDRETAKSQSRNLMKDFQSFFGIERLPMLVVDSPQGGAQFSARRAAVSGFMTFSRGSYFAFHENGDLNHGSLDEFIRVSEETPSMIFGFTFLIWSFMGALRESPRNYMFESSFLLHGGGWKKLEQEAVTRDQFSSQVSEQLGVKSVRNYYGMIEQTGAVYFECDRGFLHAPSGGGFVIRNPLTLDPVSPGTSGVIQVLSDIQHSYPGHSLLTEDLGVNLGFGCECGKETSRLAILGRMSQAEIRGCSDAI